MCGIAGILSTQGSALDFSKPLAAMRDALRHRGPDDSGLWVSPTREAAFAHTRLSILDLSEAGHQPMSISDGRFTITFNGEIYNFLELRARLERQGVQFVTRTDTEVLLRLYERKGAECVEDLRGMFAFAIWDERERSCFVARDRFGIKPLYFAETPGRLVFASELRALLASGLIDRKLDPAALAHYFETGSIPEPFSLVAGVRALEAGCSLEWRAGTTGGRRWWQIQFRPESSLPAVEAVRRVRAALLDSVEHHFVSDVPVGIFLSGGVDSSALLALAKATGRGNIRTFSIGVDDPALDESPVARRTARHFGTSHEEMRLDASRGRELFGAFLNNLDQPSIDGFNTFSVSALAHDHGMKVVLSGLGGDELFGGYPSFARLPGLLSQSRMLGPLRGIAGATLERFAPQSKLRRLGDALRNGGGLRTVYKAFRGIFSREEARRLAARFTGSPLAAEIADFPAPPPQPSLADDISALEITHYMRNQLLKDSDVMSMAHGLELRVPLVDSGLFDVLAKIPAPLRLREGKQLLVEAVPEIPEWVSNAPKRGFLFPYQLWLESPEWMPEFKAACADLPLPAENWYQRWSVFVLRRCCETLGLDLS